jgi:hypothetical protein
MAAETTIIHKARSTFLISGIALAALVLSAILVARANDESGVVRPPDFTQSVSASDQGLTIRVEASAFSGTATDLVVSVTHDDASVAAAGLLFEIAPDAFSLEGLHRSRSDEEVILSPGRARIIRLTPVQPGRAPFVQIHEVTMISPDGSREQVAGVWRLPLDTPSDLVTRLRVEHLSVTAPSAVDGEIEVRLEGVVRSTTETLATVQINSGKKVAHLGQPKMRVDGNEFFGELITAPGESGLTTFRFPPTEFGTPVILNFGPFTSSQGSRAGSVELHLDGALGELGSQHGEQTARRFRLPPEANRQISGDDIRFVAVTFDSTCRTTQYPGYVCAVLELQGAEPAPGIPPAIGVRSRLGGQQIPAMVFSTGFHKDDTGAIRDGSTEIRIWVREFSELSGGLIVDYTGQGVQIIRGNWQFDARP